MFFSLFEICFLSQPKSWPAYLSIEHNDVLSPIMIKTELYVFSARSLDLRYYTSSLSFRVIHL